MFKTGFFNFRFFELNKMHEQGSNSGDHLVGGAPVRKGKGGETKHVLLSHKMKYNNFVYFFHFRNPYLGQPDRHEEGDPKGSGASERRGKIT